MTILSRYARPTTANVNRLIHCSILYDKGFHDLHRLSLLLVGLLTMIVQACAPQLPPTIEPILTSNFSSTPATTESPPIPTITPSTTEFLFHPKVTSPTPQPQQESGEPASLCLPTDLELYKLVVLPLLDQIVVVSQEATRLATLPADRVPALYTASLAIQAQLAGIQPPQCLQEAHNAAIEGASLLVRALESIDSADYSQAETTLRASFEMVALAVALINIQTWETTPTSTPTVCSENLLVYPLWICCVTRNFNPFYAHRVCSLPAG